MWKGLSSNILVLNICIHDTTLDLGLLCNNQKSEIDHYQQSQFKAHYMLHKTDEGVQKKMIHYWRRWNFSNVNHLLDQWYSHVWLFILIHCSPKPMNYSNLQTLFWMIKGISCSDICLIGNRICFPSLCRILEINEPWLNDNHTHSKGTVY